MTDEADLDAIGELPEGIAGLLARADVWTELPVGLEDAVVAAIAAERAPVALVAPRAYRAVGPRRITAWTLAAAATIALVVAGAALVTRSDDQVALAESTLAGTDLAPGATGAALFEATPAGLRIVLDVAGLAGAPDGEMYEAWIGDGEIRVSCGSFHLRGGDEPIALWAGTADPAFHLMTVTREPIDGVADSSGQVVLRGEFDMPPPTGASDDASVSGSDDG